MIDLIAVFVCLLFSAFFSGSETALTAVSRARLFYLIREGNKRAVLASKLREKKDMLIGAILLGNTFANIMAASVSTALAIHVWGDEYGPLYATLIATPLILIFAEVIPKTIAIHHAERASLFVARPLAIIVGILSPVARLVQALVRFLLRIFGVDYSGGNDLISATDVIRGTIELHHHEGHVEKGDRDMLGSILDLGERQVEEVMTHRSQVYAINIGDEPTAIIEQVMQSEHSRIPLYRDSTDNILGILHAKDVLRLLMTQKIGITREMIRRTASKPWFVPESTALDDQLMAFREKRKHFACVVNEYGSFLGIVTLEDIIEEIVGEIDDEHDALEIDTIIPFGESAWRVEGNVTIRDLNRHLDWNLPDEHATTIAGLILHEAEMIPEQGAIFEFYGVRFTIAERKGNQITQLVIERTDEEEEE